jgi:hypothetical protein
MGTDDADACGIELKQLGEYALEHVRGLGRVPDFKSAVTRVSDNAARLKRRRCETRDPERALDDVPRLLDRQVDAAAIEAVLKEDIRADRMEERCVRGDRGFDRRQDGYLLVLDENSLGGVLGRVAARSQCDCDRLPHVPDDVAREERTRRTVDLLPGRVERSHEVGHINVTAGEDGLNAFNRPSGCEIDRAQSRVGM